LIFLRLTESNIEELATGLSELHQEVRNQKHDSAYWRWRYLKNPVGKTNLIVAIRGGRVIGMFGKIYIHLTVQAERMVASLMENLIIRPSEHSWQCLRGLLEMSLSESLDEEVTFGYGFATPLSLELSKRLGGVNLGRVPIYSGLLNVARVLEWKKVPYPLSLLGWLAQPLLGLRERNRGSLNLDIKRVENFDDSFNELWSDIEKIRSIAIIKDSDYLKWRYMKYPYQRYRCLAAYQADRVEGLVVFRTGAAQHDAYVLELLARNDNPEIMRALMFQTFRELRANGTGLVTASFLANSQASNVLKGLGFKSWSTRLWNMYITISRDPKKESCPEFDLENWDFSLGDWLYY
jgi:hypothetical protein